MHDGPLQESSDCVAIDQQMINRTRVMINAWLVLCKSHQIVPLNVAIDQQMINRTRVMINAWLVLCKSHQRGYDLHLAY